MEMDKTKILKEQISTSIRSEIIPNLDLDDENIFYLLDGTTASVNVGSQEVDIYKDSLSPLCGDFFVWRIDTYEKTEATKTVTHRTVEKTLQLGPNNWLRGQKRIYRKGVPLSITGELVDENEAFYWGIIYEYDEIALMLDKQNQTVQDGFVLTPTGGSLLAQEITSSVTDTPEPYEKTEKTDLFNMHLKLYLKKYKKLQAKGLIEIDENPDNGLAYDCKLTDAGLAILDEVASLESDWKDVVGITDSDNEVLKKLALDSFEISYKHKKKLGFIF